jgi:zinc D-Ala-D-Ala carboxypeptidase
MLDMRAKTKRFIHRYWISAAIILLLLLILGLGYYRYRLLRAQNRTLEATVATLRASAEQLQDNLSLTAYERDRLTYVLDETQQQSVTLQDQTTSLEARVQEYEKLQTLDPELLKKYSKVYFLNEQYVPSKLASIDLAYASNGKALQFHAQALPYLNALMHDSTEAGLTLRIASAYRSFGTQAALKKGYTVTYGAGANRFSADQGYSEHQLGTTVDLTTAKTGTLTTTFDSSSEAKWLRENAYKYGFILSYPKNNTYYMYEPWHWRFVGVDLATRLHDEEKYLYDLDQRTIDHYLLHIFD